MTEKMGDFKAFSDEKNKELKDKFNNTILKVGGIGDFKKLENPRENLNLELSNLLKYVDTILFKTKDKLGSQSELIQWTNQNDIIKKLFNVLNNLEGEEKNYKISENLKGILERYLNLASTKNEEDFEDNLIDVSIFAKEIINS